MWQSKYFFFCESLKLIISLFTIDQLISLRARAYFFSKYFHLECKWEIYWIGDRQWFWICFLTAQKSIPWYKSQQVSNGIKVYDKMCIYWSISKKKLHRCVQNLIPFPNKRSLDPFENNWRNIFWYLKIIFSSQFVCRLCTGLSCSVSELYVSHNWTNFVQEPPSEQRPTDTLHENTQVCVKNPKAYTWKSVCQEKKGSKRVR